MHSIKYHCGYAKHTDCLPPHTAPAALNMSSSQLRCIPTNPLRSVLWVHAWRASHTQVFHIVRTTQQACSNLFRGLTFPSIRHCINLLISSRLHNSSTFLQDTFIWLVLLRSQHACMHPAKSRGAKQRAHVATRPYMWLAQHLCRVWLAAVLPC